MFINKVTSLILIIAVLIISYLSWHYLLSIYEVKYVYNFTPSSIRVDHIYKIKAMAKNSLGWNLTFRNSDINLTVIKGHSLVKIIKDSNDNIVSFSVLGKGEIDLEINSKYALNPTRIKLKSNGN